MCSYIYEHISLTYKRAVLSDGLGLRLNKASKVMGAELEHIFVMEKKAME